MLSPLGSRCGVFLKWTMRKPNTFRSFGLESKDIGRIEPLLGL